MRDFVSLFAPGSSHAMRRTINITDLTGSVLRPTPADDEDMNMIIGSDEEEEDDDEDDEDEDDLEEDSDSSGASKREKRYACMGRMHLLKT